MNITRSLVGLGSFSHSVPTPTPGFTPADRQHVPDQPHWSKLEKIRAGTGGNLGRPFTTGNVGSDNEGWRGPGHYWKGYPCASPNNCGYDSGSYRRPSGQGHGPDTPIVHSGGTIQGPGMFETSGQGVDDRSDDLSQDIADDITREIFPPSNRTDIPTGILGAAATRRKKELGL